MVHLMLSLLVSFTCLLTTKDFFKDNHNLCHIYNRIHNNKNSKLNYQEVSNYHQDAKTPTNIKRVFKCKYVGWMNEDLNSDTNNLRVKW